MFGYKSKAFKDLESKHSELRAMSAELARSLRSTNELLKKARKKYTEHVSLLQDQVYADDIRIKDLECLIKNKEKAADYKERIIIRDMTIVNHGATRAIFNLMVGPIVMRGFRLVERKDGSMFIGSPACPGRIKNNWFDMIYTPDKMLTKSISDACIEMYKWHHKLKEVNIESNI